jgi:hypothetical protein
MSARNSQGSPVTTNKVISHGSPTGPTGSIKKPPKMIDDPVQVSQNLSKYSLAIMGILLVLLILIGVCLYFMYDFSNKFYKIVSSGQDNLCNFYTCSGAGDCNNLPKIVLPDGSQVCAPFVNDQN